MAQPLPIRPVSKQGKSEEEPSHGKGIEAPIHHGHRPRDEGRGIADEIVYRAAKLFGTAETFERCLADDILAARCQATVGVGKQRTVLVRQEEARRDGIGRDTRSGPRPCFGHAPRELGYSAL